MGKGESEHAPFGLTLDAGLVSLSLTQTRPGVATPTPHSRGHRKHGLNKRVPKRNYSRWRDIAGDFPFLHSQKLQTSSIEKPREHSFVSLSVKDYSPTPCKICFSSKPSLLFLRDVCFCGANWQFWILAWIYFLWMLHSPKRSVTLWKDNYPRLMKIYGDFSSRSLAFCS